MGFNLLKILIPREGKFFKYLEEHAKVLIEGAKIFRDLMANMEKMSNAEIKEKIYTIKNCELKADKIEYKIIDELDKTFITPIDREDIHMLAVSTDRCLDIINSISRKIEIYDITTVPENFCLFADLIVEIAEHYEMLIDALDKKNNIFEIIQKMHAIENRADDLFHISMASLFKNNDNNKKVIQYKEFYEHLESVVDSIDYLGKQVRGIVVKQG